MAPGIMLISVFQDSQNILIFKFSSLELQATSNVDVVILCFGLCWAPPIIIKSVGLQLLVASYH